tara:strand:+ start:361 stop:729 length:369 start_codon:yes stop_codon:yes gene_type:complete
MSLTQSQSFAPAASAGAAGTAKFEKPASGSSLINSKSSSNNTIFYTVPSGYYFKGWVTHSNYEYAPSFNNTQFDQRWMAYNDSNASRSNALGQTQEIILPPGTTVKCGYSMTTYVLGNLFSA